jgi:hypothetical protein
MIDPSSHRLFACCKCIRSSNRRLPLEDGDDSATLFFPVHCGEPKVPAGALVDATAEQLAQTRLPETLVFPAQT